MGQEEALKPWQMEVWGDHPRTLPSFGTTLRPVCYPAASSLGCPRGNWLDYSFFIDISPFLVSLLHSPSATEALATSASQVRLGVSPGMRLLTLGCPHYGNSSLCPIWALSVSKLRPKPSVQVTYVPAKLFFSQLHVIVLTKFKFAIFFSSF